LEEETDLAPELNPALFSNIINVLKALQISGVGAHAGKLEKIHDSVNPVLTAQEVIEILDVLVNHGLAICEVESGAYFITEQGRRVLMIGV
jgi:predicted transcriptional regulator